jgi:beta-lactamase regulating signal transducer with metallopeptidase domain
MSVFGANLVDMSITAGILIAAIVIIRATALDKIPKKTFLVLWAVALCRLLIPFTIPVLAPESTAVATPTQEARAAARESIIIIVGESPRTDVGEPANPAAVPTAAHTEHSPAIATIVWAVGAVTLFGFFAVVQIKTRRELRFATLVKDLSVKSRVPIYQSDRVTTPLAVGLFRPRIILPKSMDTDNAQLLNYVLAHENYHIRRLDSLWKLLTAVALCVHWFNPMMWVMFVLVNRDLELTCDEAVVRRNGTDSKAAYAYTLIGLAEFKSKFKFGGNFAPLCNGFAKNATEERIRAIMETNTKSKIRAFANIAIGGALVAMLTVGVLVASATESDAAPTPDETKPSATTATTPEATPAESSATAATPAPAPDCDLDPNLDLGEEDKAGHDRPPFLGIDPELANLFARQSIIRQYICENNYDFMGSFAWGDGDQELTIFFIDEDGNHFTGVFCFETNEFVVSPAAPENFRVTGFRVTVVDDIDWSAD